ncbi:MAG: septum site-determining protein MinC [Limnobacter sp.]|nr:septum site-determining protein MinC [Limnobacter sp.]
MAEPPGRARARFDLKRTTFPLFSLVLRSTDLAELQAEFLARLGDSPEFFDQELLVLNLSAVRREDNDLDFDGLVAMLRRHGLQPIGAHGGSAAQMAAAARAGLVPTPEVSVASSMARAEARAQAAPAASNAAQAGGAVEHGQAGGEGGAPRQTARHDDSAARATETAAAPAVVAQNNTVLIDKPLRSGQRIYAKNADLVVLETVNFGAEIFADGNIHVYAPLRGRAIAGARGNAEARIFTTCLDPQLVAIAGVYRTIETALPDEVASKPAQIRRVGDSLLIEPL